MILIADSGSTKTTWCLIDRQGELRYFITEGYNPYFRTAASITASMLQEMPNDFDPVAVNQLHFYGAGCFPEKTNVIKEAMGIIFPNAHIHAHLDLLGAARSLLADQTGFVAILGTGSNSCVYKEGRIIQNIDSLGYLLGDEGSGCDIGKKLIADFIRDYMPQDIRELFFEEYRLSPSALMESVYNHKMINRYCASFAYFAGKHIDHSYVAALVSSSFNAFFQHLVCKYEDHLHLGFNCVGSVAYSFSALLKPICTQVGMRFEKVLKEPIEGLIAYHID